MSDTLRSQTIRLAASLPKGSRKRIALLDVLARSGVVVDSNSNHWSDYDSGHSISKMMEIHLSRDGKLHTVVTRNTSDMAGGRPNEAELFSSNAGTLREPDFQVLERAAREAGLGLRKGWGSNNRMTLRQSLALYQKEHGSKTDTPSEDPYARQEAQLVTFLQRMVGSAGKVVHTKFWTDSVWQASFSTEYAAMKAAYEYRKSNDVRVEKDNRGWTLINGRI